MSAPLGREDLYMRFGKRAIDLCLASGGLLLLTPVIGIIALLIRIRDGRPVLYVQERPGRHERPFMLLKFRTMATALPGDPPAPDAERTTTLGAGLRRWSLDELPQLINVLRGEMSLVGPRPLLIQYLPHFTPEERVRFSVRPGLTGWAQVNGRHELDWDSRLAFDRSYIEHCSLSLDLRILALTVVRVLSRDNVHVDQASVMAPFDEVRRPNSTGRPM